MGKEFLPNRIYFILFSLLGIVYVTGLFVPLMDKDSPHYAGIALRMHLTGDYITLMDQKGNYLDKPHLLFWLAAFCYKIVGVSAFAYKLPSFLFTLVGTYSTYRLGKILYTHETGKLAALIVASSFAYILANNDVRMDAILTACIVFTSWQLVEFVDTKSVRSIAGAALGMALGFSAKGHIALFTPAVAIVCYILYRKEWRIVLNPKWLILALLFALFTVPVVYSYYLQYNLHPEIEVRGKNNIDGVRFILFSQSIDRFSGTMGLKLKNDYTFLLHSFLWAFAPWSIIAYISVVGRIKNFFARREEWLTTGCFIIVLLVFSLSEYKLPHYVNILFPFASIMAAAFILSLESKPKWIKRIWLLQLIISLILVLLMAVLNSWAFPLKNVWLLTAVVLLVGISYFLIKNAAGKWQQLVVLPACVMIVSFFLLNTNFYPQLLHYQGGSELAFKTKGKVDSDRVYFWGDQYSPSYPFYTHSFEKVFSDDVLNDKRPAWVLLDERRLPEIKQQGYEPGQYYAAKDYSIAKLKLSFLNPATRDHTCNRVLLVQINRVGD